MSLPIRSAPPHAAADPWGPADADPHTVAAVCAEVLRSLPRRDQRDRGLEYVRGLLVTPGRKSIRSIASETSGSAGDQRLQHFVSSSTWGWNTVRRALFDCISRTAPAHAWVPRPVTIQRKGRCVVGVARYVDADSGESSLGQRAIGLWSCSPSVVSPFDWRLRLPRAWVEDPERRRRSALPPDVRAESDTEAIVSMCTAVARWGIPLRPLVLDAAGLDVAGLLRGVRPAGLEVLARVDTDTQVVVDDDALRGHDVAAAGAGRLLECAGSLRRPLPGGAGWVVAARVRLPSPVRSPVRSGRPGGLLLVGRGREGSRRPDQLWLSNMVSASPVALLGLGGALSRVADRERAGSAEQVGVGHFGGRSFDGWHRHVTLASVAHAVRELASAPSDPSRYAPHAVRRGRPRHPGHPGQPARHDRSAG